MAVDDVSFIDVVSHLEDMKLRGLAPASIQTRRRALHAWWSWMIYLEIVTANPVAKVKSPKVPKRRKPFLGEADFNRLLELCPLNTFICARRASMLWIMATTGMRPGPFNC